MRIMPIFSGLVSYVPGLYHKLKKGTGGTISAEYCYSVWMRHMILAHKNQLNSNPKIVAELGPGDSLGIGLIALLCGAEKYYAFDVVEFANLDRNLVIFDKLVLMLKGQIDVPDDMDFPRIKPKLTSYKFPSEILSDERLSRTLKDTRISRIRNSIIDCKSKNSMIEYKVPWDEIRKPESSSIDMIFSQAVLEHVNDLELTYRAMNQWLKTGAYMSHQIDFKCHGIFDVWNGHLACSELIWKIIKGRKPFLLNREPCSSHEKYLHKFDFKIVNTIRAISEEGIHRGKLASKYRDISDDDLKTSGVFIQSTKY